jgi:hypothetical protein
MENKKMKHYLLYFLFIGSLMSCGPSSDYSKDKNNGEQNPNSNPANENTISTGRDNSTNTDSLHRSDSIPR